MKTFISSKVQKIMDGNTDKEIKRIENQIDLIKEKITKPFLSIFIFLIFIFCMMTDRPTDKENNYTLKKKHSAIYHE